MSMEYIRNTYGIPAKRGARVEYSANGVIVQGTIQGTKGAYLRIKMDGDKVSRLYHPTWQLKYLEESP